MHKTLLVFLLFIALLSLNAKGQGQTNPSAYDPHDFFVEKFVPMRGNEFRSAKGVPGPKYWQNSASYEIHALLSEKDTSISGAVTITYTNNSPDELEYLWLQLDQNIFRPSSIGASTAEYPGDYFGVKGEKKGGYHLGNITVVQDGKTYTVQPVITDTRMQLSLQTPMKPQGGKVMIKMSYNFLIPTDGAGRFGQQYTNNGVIYQVAQWYPRMCVYDDVRGWNTLPYLGQGEFYLEYGDYDYYVTAPSSMLVYGSGDLQNAKEVLTTNQIKRLEKAAASDKTVTIIGADEAMNPSTRPRTTGNLTWHFKMKNARDVAWVAGKGMIWDAARINLPSGRKALAMSAYPVESRGDSAWSRSTEYLKAAIEIYSKNFYEYPWNNAVSSAGITGGMEYPGIIFNNYQQKDARLWFLVAHEIGHNWYPMIVGSNERRYMWQDEGLNSYINYIATDLFNKGEYVNHPAYLTKSFFASRDYEQFMHYKDPLMTVTDAMDVPQHWQYYGRTAYGLNLLRTVIVGEERFDNAFRKYTAAWAFKHPTPYDFFHCIDNATGEDLDWFWEGFFFTNWKLDQAIADVTYVDNDVSKGALITIVNKDKMIMPVILKIIQSGGKSEILKLPVEVWHRSNTWVYHYPSAVKIEKVILDPGKVLPDMDRSNNDWVIKGRD